MNGDEILQLASLDTRDNPLSPLMSTVSIKRCLRLEGLLSVALINTMLLPITAVQEVTSQPHISLLCDSDTRAGTEQNHRHSGGPPGENEILGKVRAIAIDQTDWKNWSSPSPLVAQVHKGRRKLWHTFAATLMRKSLHQAVFSEYAKAFAER